MTRQFLTETDNQNQIHGRGILVKDGPAMRDGCSVSWPFIHIGAEDLRDSNRLKLESRTAAFRRYTFPRPLPGKGCGERSSLLVNSPEHPHRVRRSVRNDERIQANVGITHSLLDFFDRFVELNLRIGCSEVSDAFRVYEYYVLARLRQKPNYESGWKLPASKNPTPRPLLRLRSRYNSFPVK